MIITHLVYTAVRKKYTLYFGIRATFFQKYTKLSEHQ